MTGRRFDADLSAAAAFGPYRFDRAHRLLTRGGETVRLPPKALDLLDALLTHANEIASRELLLDTLWPDTVVEEANLAKLVFLLRKELGTREDGRAYIETIPKRGYRFVGELHAVAQPEVPVIAAAGDVHPPRRRTLLSVSLAIVILAAGTLAWWRHTRAKPPARRTYVVVLPFTAAAGTDAPFAAGISEFIGARLARVPGLETMPPALAGPAMKDADVREAARKVGATLIVTGSVARAGDRIRITYTVSSPAEGSELDARSFTAASSDIFELEERVGGSVASLLELHQSIDTRADPALRAPASQRAYIQALGILASPPNEMNFADAIALLEPLAREPAPSPLVLAALGRAHLLRFRQGRSPRELELAAAFASRAAQAGGDLARVHMLLGGVYRERGELPRAIAELTKARDVDPNAVDVLLELGVVYRLTARHPDAERTFDYVIRTHPECAVCFNTYGVYYARTHRRIEAAAKFRRVIELDPDGAAGYVNLAAMDADLGRHAEAAPLLEKAARLAPNMPVVFYNLGETLLVAGRYLEAAAALTRNAELEPDDPHNWGLLGDALARIPGRAADARRAYDRAIEHARAAVHATPADSEAHATLAELLAKRGEAIAEANAELRKALAGKSPSDETYLSAAAVATIAGDHAHAIDYLEHVAASEISPQNFVHDPTFAPLRNEPRFQRLANAPTR